MKKWLPLFVLPCAFLFAQEEAWSDESVDDSDLFRRDEQVFSVHASFLYWRVQESALDYALKMQHASPGGTVYAQGKYHRACFDGEPGFRVALGFFRALRYWELWAQYTRLTARGEDQVSAPTQPDRFLTGTWPHTVAGPLTEARSNIHLNYNVADWLVDRFANPNPHLRVRFIAGATVAWINQNWVVRYYETDVVTQIRNQWKFIGAGLRAGSSFDWFCGYDIYMTGALTLAPLLGSYHNISHQSTITSPLFIRDAHYFDIRPTFTIQTIFGLSWQKNFCASRWEVFAGYELNTWFNLMEIYRSTASADAFSAKETLINSGLLALQGLTTRVSVDF